MNQPLDLNIGKQLITAIQRLNQLQTATIITTNDEAEKAGLEKFVRESLFNHASVLASCWFAVQTEYEPLISGFAALLRRSDGVNAMRQMAMQEQMNAAKPQPAIDPTSTGHPAPQQESATADASPAPSNIITLERPAK